MITSESSDARSPLPFATRRSAAFAHLTDDQVADQVTTIAAQIAAATYRFLVLLVELDRRQPWAGMGIVSTAHWLNVKCGMDMVSASEKVRVARALPGLPLIAAAFARGEVSYSKVRAMTRAATPANEDYFLNIAKSGTATHVERLVRLYRRCERQQEDARAAEQERARSFRYWKLADGSVRFEGQLPPEAAAVFVKAMEAARDVMREGAAEKFPAGNGPAGAMGEGGATDGREPVPPKGIPARGPGPLPGGNADALVVMAQTMLAHGAAPVNGGERYEVVVHVAEPMLTANGEGPAPELEDGSTIAPETARRIACDCGKVCVHEDERGEILSVGRKTRTIPPAIRRALRTRDRGCRFPGCTSRRFVDAHHIQHWADGGETKMSNLVLLCSRHHTLVHEGRWTIRAGAEGVEFVRWDGHAFGPTPLGGDDFVNAVETFEREHAVEGLRIGSNTIVPAGTGNG